MSIVRQYSNKSHLTKHHSSPRHFALAMTSAHVSIGGSPDDIIYGLAGAAICTAATQLVLPQSTKKSGFITPTCPPSLDNLNSRVQPSLVIRASCPQSSVTLKVSSGGRQYYRRGDAPSSYTGPCPRTAAPTPAALSAKDSHSGNWKLGILQNAVSTYPVVQTAYI